MTASQVLCIWLQQEPHLEVEGEEVPGLGGHSDELHEVKAAGTLELYDVSAWAKLRE
jgi:hypothetical protein